MKLVYILIITLLALATFSPFNVLAEKLTRTVQFEVPDIHDDFCGAKIDYRICKCARHGDMCKDINREKNIANFILQSKYKAYVIQLRTQFMLSCTMAGGRFSDDKCGYYEKSDKEKQCLPGDFESDWKKYSDIDEAIPANDRSFEAKNVHETGAKLKNVLAGLYILDRDIEMNRLMLNEFKDYRKAVATNFKVNMLKSFWRLAWLTYDTSAGAAAPMRLGSEGSWLFQGGTDLGRSFAKLFDDDTVPGQQLAVLAKLARESMGDNSKYNFDTSSWDGKVGAVSMTTLIAFFESAGNPTETAKEMFQEITKQSLPSVDVKLSEEDIKLLADHYNKTKKMDDVIQEANRKMSQMQLKRDELLKQKEELKTEFTDWEEKEKERVLNNLVEDCKK